ncbi:MAG: hypothetical protein WBM36_05860, partial [Lysobacterales bacterium]
RVGIAYTVATWLLIQVTDTVFPRIGLPDSAVTLVIALLVIGFIPALIFAWAFEMTPDGIKREKDVDRSQSIAPVTGRKLDRVIIGVLTVLVAYLLIDKLVLVDSEPLPQNTTVQVSETDSDIDTLAPSDTTADEAISEQSVAVLPFVSMSSGEDDSYFADGLTEEILNSLARLPELLVTARTSSFHFKDKNMPIPEIAATLGVKHIVEGSVRRSGDRVRITAQLVRAEDGFHLWSDTYDRTLEDVFAVQENIAENIAETLDVVLNEEKRQRMRDARIEDVEAFIAYQKGIEMMEKAHAISDPVDLLPEANRFFDQALALVPSITNAQMERTDLFGHILFSNAAGIKNYTPAELEDAREQILAGLTQVARYAQSDAQRAYVEAERAEFSGDWSGIPARLDRAFQTEECYAVNWVSSLAAIFGWAEQVAAHYERLMRCDPLSGLYVAMGGQFMIWAGKTEEAVKVTSHFLDNVAFQPWADDIRFAALLASGDYHDAPDLYASNPEGSFYEVPRKILAYAIDNEIDRAREILEVAKNEAPV